MRATLRSPITWTLAGVLLAAFFAGRALPTRAQEGPGRGASDIEERTVTVGGTQRTYGIHVPQNVTHPAPVVMLSHGGGGRPQAIARRSGMTEVSDQNGFIAVYPQGDPQASGRGGTWNIGSEQSVSSGDDVAFVKAILADLERGGSIDHARIYATGHSMGGIFSYRLACEMSDTFAAIAPVSATMVEPSCHPSSPVAVFHIHGAADDRIPLKGGRGDRTAGGRTWPAPLAGLASWSKIDNCSGEPTKARDGEATCTTYGKCSATVEYCVLPDEGHTWPEGASERIWDFFKAHPKPAS